MESKCLIEYKLRGDDNLKRGQKVEESKHVTNLSLWHCLV